MKKNNELLQLLAKHGQDMAYFNSCQEAKRLKRELIAALEAELSEYKIKAQEALTKPGNALENGREATACKEAAGITEARISAAEAELAALPEGNRSSIRYELQGALRVKLNTLTDARKKYLSDAYARWGVSLTEGLWNIIPRGATNDTLASLRRATEDVPGVCTVETAERHLKLLEEELE
ncbi:MAG: hypothetical protein JWM59_3287 [Verrucomicrobiales bacterium]|nr:hypothetical protein [Verrucomicrobiales bacterium]